MIQLGRLLLCGAGWLAAGFVHSALAGTNTPTRVGPYGGAVHNVAFHPSDASIVYATTSAGFYRSTDSGQSWQLVSDQILYGAIDMAVHPSQPNRVFVVAHSAPGVWASADAGATLSVLDASFQFRPTGNDIEYSADGSVLYVSTGRQVHRSTDHGATWLPGGDIPVGQYYASNLIVDPADPHRLYIVGDAGQAFQSADAGVTWQAWSVPSEMIFDLAVANAQPSPRIWAATSLGIRYTDDRGTSWTYAHTGSTRSVTVDPHDPTVVYAGTHYEGLLRTQDNGEHWSSIRGDAYSAAFVAIDPTDANRLLINGGGGILRSGDGGTQWISSHTGIDALISHELVSSAASDRIYVVAESDGIHVISPEDGTTAPLNNSELRQVAGQYGFYGMGLAVLAGTPDRMFIAAGRRILRSLDAGESWSAHDASPLDGFYRIVNASADGSRLLGTTLNRLYSTSDGGTTWTEIPAMAAKDLNVMASAPSNPQTIYVAGRLPGATRDVILRSRDGGNTWTTHDFPGVDVLAMAVDPSNDQTLYTSGGMAELFKSTDGGQSWTMLTVPGDYTRQGNAFWALTIDPQNPNIVYVAGGSFIARSVDAGATWQQLWYDTERFFDIRSLLVDPLRPHSLYIGMPHNGVREISIQPDLRIAVTSADLTSGYGTAASYSYSVSNTGPFDATNVSTRVQLPAGATNILATSTAGTCTVAGTIVTCTAPILRTTASANITIDATHPTSGDFDVVATVEGDQPDAASADNSVTSDITVAEVSDLSVMLTGSSIISRGEAANLTLRVTNTGPNEASVASVTLELANGFTIASVTPSAGTSTCVNAGNTLACQMPQLAVGASVSIAIVTSATTAAGSFTHMATVDASGTDQRGANNVSSAVTTVSDVGQSIGNSGSGGGGGGGISLSLLTALLLLSRLRIKTRVL